MEKRECGECTACCTVMGVPTLSKPPYSPCPHALPKVGCGCYETRPKECQAFYCFWMLEDRLELMGITPPPGQRKYMLRNMERPDRVGVMIDMTDKNSDFTKETGMGAFVARETKLGAFAEPDAQDVIKRLAKRQLVIMSYNGNKRTFVGPQLAIDVAVKFFNKKFPSG